MRTNLPQLEVLLSEQEYSYICVTETHQTEKVTDSEISIFGYKLYRTDSMSNHTGGVAIYINNKHETISVSKVENGMKFWWLSVKVEMCKRPMQVIGVYRSPNNQPSPEQEFCEFIEETIEEMTGGEVIIMGDMNINWFERSAFKYKLEQIIVDISLTQKLSFPIRITNNTQTSIDYVITNISECEVKADIESKISDHTSIVINIKAKSAEIKQSKQGFTRISV